MSANSFDSRGYISAESTNNLETRAVSGNPLVSQKAVRIEDSNGNAITPQSASSSTATISRVASSNSNVNLLASNTSRKSAIFFNDSTSQVYVKFGATASSSSFTYKMNPNDTLELKGVVYTGQIDAIWVSTNGNMQITELT
jgi:hypothetical protein